MPNFNWNNKTILITGGTGSFGNNFVKYLLQYKNPKKIIIFSRDELKQFEMQQEYLNEKSLRFFIGDIRDYERLFMAFNEVDVVVHAAALKQVVACEYNPFEAIKTNIIGAENIIRAAIERKISKVISVSTDKAVNPNNLYGGTKFVAEKLFSFGNNYSGNSGTQFSSVRYGNVIGSRGSIAPLFKKQRKNGYVTITDSRMTRFWITLVRGIELVIDAIENANGGEIFVPKIPSMSVVDFASSIAPDCKHKIIGIRPGEKLHEYLISEDESRYTLEYDNKYIIYTPEMYNELIKSENFSGKILNPGFYYSSDKNDEKITTSKLLSIIDF